MAHRSRRRHTGVGAGIQESAHAHKASNATDFAFVAHRIKGIYDQRAVGHERGRSRNTAVENFRVRVNTHKSLHTGVGTRTKDRKYFGCVSRKCKIFLDSTASNAKDFASACLECKMLWMCRSQMQNILHFDSPRLESFVFDGLSILYFVQDLMLLIKIPWISLVSSSSGHAGSLPLTCTRPLIVVVIY
jgi:hypothetical protein